MQTLWPHMRVPTITFVTLMVLLGGIVLLGATLPFPSAWILEAALAAAMVVVVLLFSMELLREPPLMRVLAAVGFVWVTILMGITVIDYLTR
jgi:cytochrome c oxidase subunit IV